MHLSESELIWFQALPEANYPEKLLDSNLSNVGLIRGVPWGANASGVTGACLLAAYQYTHQLLADANARSPFPVPRDPVTILVVPVVHRMVRSSNNALFFPVTHNRQPLQSVPEAQFMVVWTADACPANTRLFLYARSIFNPTSPTQIYLQGVAMEHYDAAVKTVPPPRYLDSTGVRYNVTTVYGVSPSVTVRAFLAALLSNPHILSLSAVIRAVFTVPPMRALPSDTAAQLLILWNGENPKVLVAADLQSLATTDRPITITDADLPGRNYLLKIMSATKRQPAEGPASRSGRRDWTKESRTDTRSPPQTGRGGRSGRRRDQEDSPMQLSRASFAALSVDSPVLATQVVFGTAAVPAAPPAMP